MQAGYTVDMRPTLVFDVEGTLLDPAVLDPLFVRAFGDASYRAVWQHEVQRLCFLCLSVAGYHPYEELAETALGTMEARSGTTLDDMTIVRIRAARRSMPPYPDVPGALTRLRDHGFTMHVLANGDQQTVEEMLRNAGIGHFFSTVQTTELSEAYKPKPEVYRNALAIIDAEPDAAMLVTSHDWDAVGAARLGMKTALVARDGTVPSPLADDPPRILARDLTAVEERLRFFPATSGAL